MFELEAFGAETEFSLNAVLLECKERRTPDVSVITLYRWWKTYLEWGELPYVVKKRKLLLKKKMAIMGICARIDDQELEQLKNLVDDNLQLYLDEISLQFGA